MEIWVQRGGRKEEEPASGTSPGIWQNHFLLLGYQAKSDEIGGTTDHQEPDYFLKFDGIISMTGTAGFVRAYRISGVLDVNHHFCKYE